VTASRAVEPTPALLAFSPLRYFLATRPAFLTITLVGVLLGFATAWHADADFDVPAAIAALALAILAHAGVNVLNDYYDHLNGSDAANTERVFPFTGGSRFIQNGVLTPAQTRTYGAILFLVVVLGGVWLVMRGGGGLFWIGLAGLFVGWAYSAPPLKLNSRGLGEPSVAGAFLLVVVGADYVQRGEFSSMPWLTGLPYALMVTNILYINQFPDRAADLQAGKRHWVARLDPDKAVYGYGLILLLAMAGLGWLMVIGELPVWSALILVAGLPAAQAAYDLRRFARQPARLIPAIRRTIVAAHLFAILLAMALVLDKSGLLR
jgi:1,4-dihydroxy-2-naphthoate polyprenyltransferase